MSKKKSDPAPETAALDDDVAPEPSAPEPDEVAPEPEPASVAAVAAPAPVEYYRVKAFAKYCVNGSVYSLAEGAVISSAHYDLADVRAQGVPLEPTTEDKLPPARTLVQ
jgi:hypothetical protein